MNYKYDGKVWEKGPGKDGLGCWGNSMVFWGTTIPALKHQHSWLFALAAR